jgi:tetratricopeptide (TPR) repeat protein
VGAVPAQLKRTGRNGSVKELFACPSRDGYNESVSSSLRVRIFALGLLVTATSACPPARSADRAGSKTVIGPTNSLLADGAAALEAGRIEEGVRLTLEGLKATATLRENAAGHSNACAGYVLLKRWAEALAQCNAALELDTSNWRTYNNRASIYVEQGLYDLAMRDLEAGLALAPGAPILHESVRILQRNKQLAGRQARKVVPS